MTKLKSRKLWLAILGAVTPIMGQLLSDDITLEKALMASSAIIISYIFGQAYVDGKAAAPATISMDDAGHSSR
jgi:hypothetical protein